MIEMIWDGGMGYAKGTDIDMDAGIWAACGICILGLERWCLLAFYGRIR
jgi:hypothetical protein